MLLLVLASLTQRAAGGPAAERTCANTAPKQGHRFSGQQTRPDHHASDSSACCPQDREQTPPWPAGPWCAMRMSDPLPNSLTTTQGSSPHRPGLPFRWFRNEAEHSLFLEASDGEVIALIGTCYVGAIPFSLFLRYLPIVMASPHSTILDPTARGGDDEERQSGTLIAHQGPAGQGGVWFLQVWGTGRRVLSYLSCRGCSQKVSSSLQSKLKL